MPRAPPSTHTTSVSPPIHAGISRRLRSVSALAARHGSAGPTPMRNSSASPIGTPSFTKYGSPTVICLSCSACTSSGNTVPVSTTSAKPANNRLLSRNAASRDSGESMRPGDRSSSPRHAIKPDARAPRSEPRNVSSHGPIDDVLNACTELSTPERVRNVPRIVRQNVAITSDRFQTRSIPRRSCTITEWMNATAVSHGSSDAFSTGSQPQ